MENYEKVEVEVLLVILVKKNTIVLNSSIPNFIIIKSSKTINLMTKYSLQEDSINLIILSSILIKSINLIKTNLTLTISSKLTQKKISIIINNLISKLLNDI